MLYMSAPELAELTGFKVNQYACMSRWLKRHQWPFEQDRHGLPRVLRAYHDQRLLGQGAPATLLTAANADAFTPRFDALKGLHHGRKTKGA